MRRVRTDTGGLKRGTNPEASGRLTQHVCIVCIYFCVKSSPGPHISSAAHGVVIETVEQNAENLRGVLMAQHRVGSPLGTNAGLLAHPEDTKGHGIKLHRKQRTEK